MTDPCLAPKHARPGDRVHPPYYCTGTIVYEGCPCFGPLAFIDSAAP